MHILRQVFPQGFPIIVDAQLDGEGGVVQDSVTIYPIQPDGIIGEPIFNKSAPEMGVLDEIIQELLEDNEADESDI
jgi:hypothetical protein|tara:strand:- start:112 stop:339 length:228 start_codon:yes stop_codon:yes gene_type:complete